MRLRKRVGGDLESRESKKEKLRVHLRGVLIQDRLKGSLSEAVHKQGSTGVIF